MTLHTPARFVLLIDDLSRRGLWGTTDFDLKMLLKEQAFYEEGVRLLKIYNQTPSFNAVDNKTLECTLTD